MLAWRLLDAVSVSVVQVTGTEKAAGSCGGREVLLGWVEGHLQVSPLLTEDFA